MNIPQNKRNGPDEIDEHVKSFAIRLNHDMSTQVRKQLVDIYDLSVHPIVDTLNRRIKVLNDDKVEEELDESEMEAEDERWRRNMKDER